MSLDRYNDRLSFIWGVKDVLRDTYKRHQYREVILPFAVMRRLDCVLANTKNAVLKESSRIGGDPDKASRLLSVAAREPFYNTSQFDFGKLVAHKSDDIYENLLDYMNGFSRNIRDILSSFGSWNEVKKLEDAGLLFQVVRKFSEVDLHPDSIDNSIMGQIYEELIRRTADLSNEEAGEHYTPREVVQLMVDLVLSDDDAFTVHDRVFKVYDPACGTGGMLTAAERRIRERNTGARVHLFGQEVSPETWALCQTDMLLTGHDPSQVAPHSTLSRDGHDGERFHYMLANPPYGKKWETDKAKVLSDAAAGESGCYPAGVPKINDGQTLFLQKMLAKMRPLDQGGSRIAIVMSYSPLTNGEPGERENALRKWILDRDLLDCIVALPEFLFYNTPIYTCIWILSNRKPNHRKDLVQLIDGRDLFERLRWPQGKKRHELRENHIAEIVGLYETGKTTNRSKVVSVSAFGYRRISVARPLRLRWEFTEHALRSAVTHALPKRAGEELRETVSTKLQDLLGTSESDLHVAEAALSKALVGLRLTPAVRRKVLEAFSVRDPEASPLRDADGGLVPDPEEVEEEYLPLDLPIESFMSEEILPYDPQAFVLPGSEIVGYDIPVTVWFHRYGPPRPLIAIREDLDRSVKHTYALLTEVTR